MSNPRTVVALMCAGVLAACGSGGSQSADIGKVSELKSSFGPDFKVTEVPRTGIDPKLLAGQKLAGRTDFRPARLREVRRRTDSCRPAPKGNMAAVSAEGEGNRFIVDRGRDRRAGAGDRPGTDNCKNVTFSGGAVRGSVDAVDAPHDRRRTDPGRAPRPAGHRSTAQPRTGEMYNYSAHFGDYQVLVTANPLVCPTSRWRR